MPDQTPEPPLQSDAALAELRARLTTDGTLAPVPEELAPLCPVCLCGVVDDVVDLDDGSLIHGECMPVDVMIGQINTERDESARLRARIAELEREVTKWHGMYRVASDRRDQNLSDYQQASRWAAWFAAERDELARQRAFELEAIAERQRMYRDRIAAEEQRAGEMARLAIAEQESAAALRARIAELEAAQANPDAYIAVKRTHSPNADRPEWDWHAIVIPAGDEFAEDRDWRLDRGFDLVPIVGTETGTRPAAVPQSRCQTTTAIAVWDGVADGRSIWCELPDGHDGKRHATVPQPGNVDATVDWGNPPTERIGYAIGYCIDGAYVSWGSERLYAAPTDAAKELATVHTDTPFRVYELREVQQ